MRAALTPVVTMAGKLTSQGPLLPSEARIRSAAPGNTVYALVHLIPTDMSTTVDGDHVTGVCCTSAQHRVNTSCHVHSSQRAGITPLPPLEGHTPATSRCVASLSERMMNTELTCLLTCTHYSRQCTPRTHLSLSPPLCPGLNTCRAHTRAGSIRHRGHPGTPRYMFAYTATPILAHIHKCTHSPNHHACRVHILLGPCIAGSWIPG